MSEESLFGPKKSVDKFSFLWKVMSGAILVTVIFLISFLFHRMQLPVELSELSLVFDNLESLKDDKVQAGGDIVVSPIITVESELPKLTGELLPPENFSAQSIIVKDYETGLVLYKKNEYDKRSIASITKLHLLCWYTNLFIYDRN